VTGESGAGVIYAGKMRRDTGGEDVQFGEKRYEVVILTDELALMVVAGVVMFNPVGVVCYEVAVMCYAPAITCYTSIIMCYAVIVMCYNSAVMCYDSAIVCYDSAVTCYNSPIVYKRPGIT
jgi:hypothetical protein